LRGSAFVMSARKVVQSAPPGQRMADQSRHGVMERDIEQVEVLEPVTVDV
jgi:hypothetical protein